MLSPHDLGWVTETGRVIVVGLSLVAEGLMFRKMLRVFFKKLIVTMEYKAHDVPMRR